MKVCARVKRKGGIMFQLAGFVLNERRLHNVHEWKRERERLTVTGVEGHGTGQRGTAFAEEEGFEE